MERRGPANYPLDWFDPRFTCPFDLPVQALVTDVDLRERLLYALEHEQEIDGAEGAPLTFNLADLKEGLDACSPSASRPSFPAVPSSSDHSSTRTLGPLPSPPPPSSLKNTRPSSTSIAPVPSAHPTDPVNLPHAFPSPPTFISPTAPPLCAHSNPLCACRPQTPGVEKKDVKPARGRDKKLQSKLRNLKKRQAHAAIYEDGRVPNFFRTPRLSTSEHVPLPHTIKTNLDSTALPVAQHCWVGRNLVPKRSTPWTYEELLDKGFKVVPWKGGQPQAITDKDGHAVVLIVGGPTDGADWGQVVKQVAQTFASVRDDGLAAGIFPKDTQSHRRGTFVALPVGVSHGNGRLKPGNLFHPPERKKLIQRLLDDKAIRRLACYQSSVFSFYAPKLYAQYCHALLRVFEHDHSLQRNFEDSIFPATSFNLGPGASLELGANDGKRRSSCSKRRCAEF
ncbi:hypothetical protein BDN72DRAFT_805483 [Pluteus cervinus]|uniref:Uncharacterized protein n=1 Tax=Pluteus cervinus TaxID=181527 RepID=A0ACD3A4F7_9AGAR|nr:hypothetical protein BDN72DRAFT_805483 [Pluteus cervinus]